MKSDFAKLLSNCQSRINEESVKVIQISNGAIVNPPSQSLTTGKSNSDVRPEIQGIIDQKMRETGEASSKNPQDKAQILFSLKDFLDNTSKESASPSQQVDEKEDDEGISDEEGEKGDNGSDEELDENDESVKDKSFKSTSSYKDDSDIEEVSIDEDEDPLATTQKPSEEDLETEISKLDKLQRKIADNIGDPSPRPPETVLLKMGAARPSVTSSPSRPQVASREETPKETSKEIPVQAQKTGENKLNETITLDEEENTESQVNSNKTREPVSQETSKQEEKVKPKADSSSKPSENKKSSSLSEGMFKNISISIVGSGNRNVNIQNLFNSKGSTSTAPAPPTASNPSPSAHVQSSSNSASHSSRTAPPSGSAGATNTFTAGPNITLKRQGSPSRPRPSHCLAHHTRRIR